MRSGADNPGRRQSEGSDDVPELQSDADADSHDDDEDDRRDHLRDEKCTATDGDTQCKSKGPLLLFTRRSRRGAHHRNHNGCCGRQQRKQFRIRPSGARREVGAAGDRGDEVVHPLRHRPEHVAKRRPEKSEDRTNGEHVEGCRPDNLSPILHRLPDQRDDCIVSSALCARGRRTLSEHGCHRLIPSDPDG